MIFKYIPQKLSVVFFIFIVLSSPACNEDTKLDEKRYVYQVMMDYYLWYDEIPKINYNNYDSPEEVLEAMKNRELDKWSFIASDEEVTNYFEKGQVTAFGYGSGWMTVADSEGLYVLFTFENSSAGENGLKRGDRILEINDILVEDIKNNDSWDEVYGQNVEGTELDIKVQDSTGNVSNMVLTKSSFVSNTVLHSSIINDGVKKIGYIVFYSFVETSMAELQTVAENFKENEIDELIVDLRYNGGGRQDVAVYFASIIKGPGNGNDIFVNIMHNDKKTKLNNTVYYDDYNYSLDMSRVFFITTEGTASSSEFLINGLEPFLDVYLIGTQTHGKPVGMYGFTFGDKVMFPISLIGENSVGFSDYFGGMPVDKVVIDNPAKNWGDTEDEHIMEALNYINTGDFSEDSTSTGSKRNFVKRTLSKKIEHKGFKKITGIN